MRAKNLFRQEAVDHLSVAARVHTLVEVVPPAGWLALVCVGMLFVTLSIWAVCWEITYKVNGQGMLIQDGGVFDVSAVADGQVRWFAVREGDDVVKGQLIAKIEQSELTEELSSKKKHLHELSTAFAVFSKLEKKQYESKRRYFEQKAILLQEIIDEQLTQIEFHRRIVATQEELLEKGLVTISTLAESRRVALQLQKDLKESRNELKNIISERVGLENTMQQERFALKRELMEAKQEIASLGMRMKVQSTVFATRAGRVIEMRSNAGDYVMAGQPLLTMECKDSDQKDLIVVAYVPMDEGKRVNAGMAMRIIPSMVKAEKDGYMLGTVQAVSAFPVSQEAIVRVIRNEHLAQMLTKSGPVYETRASLMPDVSDKSGFRWSTGHGATNTIQSGTYCSVQIMVERARPIKLLLPTIRRILGTYAE